MNISDMTRLQIERDVLLDEATSNNRQSDVSGEEVEKIMEFIERNYEECRLALEEEPDMDIYDLINVYRNLVFSVLHNPNLIRNE